MSARVTSLVVDHLTQLLARILRSDGPADVMVSRHFKSNPQLGSHDRALLAETTFFVLRRYATLSWRLQPAHPARAPRLAALVALALAQGADALSPRALRNDERAVRNALAIDVSTAPASVTAEVPSWLFRLVTAQYHDAEALLAASAEAAPLDLRVNTIKSTRPQVLAELTRRAPERAALQAFATPFSPDGIRLSSKPALTRWPLYQSGAIEVQDEGSQLIAHLVAPRRGEMVVDFCAGAGGKTLALGALMRSTGRLYAFDTHARRLTGLGPRLKRSGLSNVHPAAIATETDVRVKRLADKIDRVLVDAPCSGLGTLRRNPDMKWRQTPEDVAELVEKQKSILAGAARLVKPGGRLVYATCSILDEENRGIVGDFLRNAPFTLRSAGDVLEKGGIRLQMEEYLELWPHRHGTDGFFGAVFERVA